MTGEHLSGWNMQYVFLCLVCLQRGHRPTDPEEVTNEALRSMCDNTLHLLTTTVGRLADVCRLPCCLNCWRLIDQPPKILLTAENVSLQLHVTNYLVVDVLFASRCYGQSCCTI